VNTTLPVSTVKGELLTRRVPVLLILNGIPPIKIVLAETYKLFHWYEELPRVYVLSDAGIKFVLYVFTAFTILLAKFVTVIVCVCAAVLGLVNTTTLSLLDKVVVIPNCDVLFASLAIIRILPDY